MARSKSVQAQINATQASITNKANTSRRAGQRRLKKGAEDIRETALDYAPYFDGNLEDSIILEAPRSGPNGRTVFEVSIDRSAPGSNGAKSMNDYATWIHEANYNLGKFSALKDQSLGGSGLGYGQGGVVGRKFLFRALEKHVKNIEKEVREAVEKGLK
jgi:hypothetical protein